MKLCNQLLKDLTVSVTHADLAADALFQSILDSEVWKYYHCTTKVHANVLQNLVASCVHMWHRETDKCSQAIRPS